MAGQVWYEEMILRQFWPHFFPLEVTAKDDMEQNNRFWSVLVESVSNKETGFSFLFFFFSLFFL